MLDHLGLNVPDLAAARRYYDAIMPMLGFEPFVSSDRQFSYQRTEGKPGTRIFFYSGSDETGFSRHRTGLQHLAFRVRTRSDVDEIHAKVVELGNDIVRGPGLFQQYHRDYYAVYWQDPHGFMLEAVCHEA
jgi:catechol 2,3-dioxygenase-like lactoylglutathione lyase family enzyme